MKGPLILELGGYRSLPLYYAKGRLLEDLHPFQSAKVQFEFKNPDYSIDQFKQFTNRSFIESQSNPVFPMLAINTWNSHFCNYEYFVQFFDDVEKAKISALHAHTEVVSLIGDTMLHMDTGVVWNRFDEVIVFENVHSNYRSDAEKESKYQGYCDRLKSVHEKLGDFDREAVRLVQRMKASLEATLARGESLAAPKRLIRQLQPKSVFISYCHADEEMRQILETHLSMLKRESAISYWHDRKILPSSNWKDEIDQNLLIAELVVLLISPDFLASNYCYEKEMQVALARHRKGLARVVPVILRPCEWKHAPIGEIQALPTDGKPVISWPNQDEAFLDVVTGLRNLINSLGASQS